VHRTSEISAHDYGSRQQSRLTPPAQAAAASGRRGDGTLRRHASTSLLGLEPVGAIAEQPQDLDAIDPPAGTNLLGLRPTRAVDAAPLPDEAAMRANSSTSPLGLQPVQALPPERTD
jgi:hypothetical protein